MLDKLEPYLDRGDLNLCARFLRRSTEYGGTFIDFYQGLSPGSPVSVVLGSFFLHDLDEAMQRSHPGVHTYRFMDDILVLAPSRWQLRRAVATITRYFSAHKLQAHPDKTRIGRFGKGLFEQGIEFLGFIVSQKGLAPSAATLKRHQAILSRLYEQSQRPGHPRFGGHPKAKIDWAQAEAATITYHKRFLTWATTGFAHVPVLNVTGADYCGL